MTNDDIQTVFEQLFETIKCHERLAQKVKFVLIPGPSDPGSDMLYPQFPLPDFILDSWKMRKENVILATNPC